MTSKAMRKNIAVLMLLLCALPLWAESARARIPLDEGPTWFPGKKKVARTEWKTVKAVVPADWKGSRVAFDVPYALSKCDMIVKVNGVSAGDILRPAGSLDISDKVRYGEENVFSWQLTESGEGTRRGMAKTVERVHFIPEGLTRAPDLV